MCQGMLAVDYCNCTTILISYATDDSNPAEIIIFGFVKMECNCKFCQKMKKLSFCVDFFVSPPRLCNNLLTSQPMSLFIS